MLLALEVGYVLGGGCTILPSYGSSKAVMHVKPGCLFLFLADSHMLDHLPFDLRLNSDIVSYLKQFSVNISSLARMSSLANR